MSLFRRECGNGKRLYGIEKDRPRLVLQELQEVKVSKEMRRLTTDFCKLQMLDGSKSREASSHCPYIQAETRCRQAFFHLTAATMPVPTDSSVPGESNGYSSHNGASLVPCPTQST